ncbi:protein SHQ1 homolog isoform X2 [Coturnix japonica]|uniref:Protein SHQ1 homolog n=2 Tax=Coturnix japonica TaxID=93934 RepID=A0A8C2UAJ7_COTJA|nr:protein SHQ1 homolog isoform X2 [Coturnix japonica]XP_015730601.1 protein SHQ1 homolog isoform X2 [Coturnix japonica]XP_015730602.1 protein SHQ1 homolog isoform X2 [Coturnix japonica]XP_015730603.1 protein SHQ1 homolog isoform X2 [Coturnix japonica]XP_015730604.1 protein SHQ1 homolog isoform X2 [Coturnix japonica]XP_015730605.1 protein SHQ1 homolog isoform X2 [Coturnix japonica]
MITPDFELSQDLDFLIITIRVPYAKVSELDLFFEGEDFKFYAKPYFLRLTLPGRVVENGREKASYDTDKGTFTIQLPKESPGQYFEGLDMLTSLLAPKKSRTAKPLVEEIGVPAELEEEEEEEFDWEIEQTLYKEAAESPLPLQCYYGFGNLRSGVFQRLQDELGDVIDLKDPDQTPIDERKMKRLEAEAAKFDPDHYLADFFEDEAIQHVLKYKPWWVDAHKKMMALQGESSQNHDSHTTVIFSEEEREQLRKFTNKSYLLDKRSRHLVYLGLIDILLAYCYEICVNEGEKNVESSWNVRKLSATLCWLECFTSIHDVLVSFGRRVVCYPLYRHFGLVTRALNDTVMILQLGRAAVLRCLLDVHRIFRESDPAYILNDLFITDYCIWIQKIKSKKLAALSESLQKTTLAKSHLGFELEELEAAAVLVLEEESKLTAAGMVSRQQLPSSESETSDSEESSSTSSSETEGSDSNERESSTAEDGKINPLQGMLQEERTAPLIDCNGLRQGTNASTFEVSDEKSEASLQSTSVPGKLIEELGEQMHTAMRLSEQPEGLAGASGFALGEQEENNVSEPVGFSKANTGKRDFLEVPSKTNTLLFLGSTNEDGD